MCNIARSFLGFEESKAVVAGDQAKSSNKRDIRKTVRKV